MRWQRWGQLAGTGFLAVIVAAGDRDHRISGGFCTGMDRAVLGHQVES
jgi:hypothetical protein